MADKGNVKRRQEKRTSLSLSKGSYHFPPRILEFFRRLQTDISHKLLDFWRPRDACRMRSANGTARCLARPIKGKQRGVSRSSCKNGPQVVQRGGELRKTHEAVVLSSRCSRPSANHRETRNKINGLPTVSILSLNSTILDTSRNPPTIARRKQNGRSMQSFPLTR